MQAIDILPLIKDRAQARAELRRNASKSANYWHASFQLWSDEYQAYEALRAVGLRDAADCAWKRRTAAADLCTILTACT